MVGGVGGSQPRNDTPANSSKVHHVLTFEDVKEVVVNTKPDVNLLTEGLLTEDVIKDEGVNR